ncbi:hypothetical protein G6F43_005610 [Rhizopus delemar]|nr:hypothetical protein G6F43_005610 [Rhizopus delemar]
MYLNNSLENSPFKVEHKENCSQCARVANYCRMTLKSSRRLDNLIECDSDLFELVQLSIQLIQYHMEHLSSWIPALFHELCELNRQLKEESVERDSLIPLSEEVNEEEDRWACAIRVAIYHCRASLYEQQNIQRSLEYYRKCLCVRPSKHTRLIQQSARVALEQLSRVHVRPCLPSRTSSVSSKGSTAHKTCSNCGREKRGMPVCSRCKSQFYCTVRCLQEHKPIHDLECGILK